MITKTSAINIEQICDNCGNTNIILVIDLVVGVSADKNIVKLPICSCGAVECLNRTISNVGYHAGLVNGLCEFLIKKGRVESKWLTEISNERVKPERVTSIKE